MVHRKRSFLVLIYGLERSHNNAFAAKPRASADVVEALRNGSAIQDSKLEAARRFAAAIATNPTEPDAGVGQRRQRAKGGDFDHRAMVAISLTAAVKTLVNGNVMAGGIVHAVRHDSSPRRKADMGAAQTRRTGVERSPISFPRPDDV